MSSLSNRILTPCLKPLGRVQNVKPIGVIDHQRPIPSLDPIRTSVNALPSATVVSDVSDEMLQAQIKINAEMMQRVDNLEAERKAFGDQIKALQAASDQSKKENAFYKTKLAESTAECNKLKEKLAKRKSDANVDSSANKENVNASN